MFYVYGKPGCQNCVEAKRALDRYGFPYQYTSVGEDITINEFLNQFPGIRTMPYILEDERVVGSHKELFERLKKENVLW